MKCVILLAILYSVSAVHVVQLSFKHEVKSDLKPIRFSFKYPPKNPPKVPIEVEIRRRTHTKAGAKGEKKKDDNSTAALQPTWKKQACEKLNLTEAVKNEDNHFICDDNGELKCLAGWQGDLCDVPICKKGCDPLQGYCKNPGECRCKMGFYGDRCNKCITLPGCQHGYCNQSFECICHKGWDGLFCSEPICRDDCHATRGYCDAPNECRCRIGWSGPTCRSCQPLPGCQHGYCEKPLECKCHPGFTGLLCQTPICAEGCDSEHGYCRRPGECRCRVGWRGLECSQCHPYPGCVHGTCNRPWECNCEPGWGGMLCDEALDYCEKNANVCKNGGTCQSLEMGDGNFRCHCPKGVTGKHCEKMSANMTTPAPLDGNSTEISNENVTESENVTSVENNETSEEAENNARKATTEHYKPLRSMSDTISNQIEKLRNNFFNLIGI